jgi:hypothetical protein
MIGGSGEVASIQKEANGRVLGVLAQIFGIAQSALHVRRRIKEQCSVRNAKDARQLMGDNDHGAALAVAQPEDEVVQPFVS